MNNRHSNRKRSQSGFSLLELMVAMMIIAVLGTLGFRYYNKSTAEARYLKAKDTLNTVCNGLDTYHLKHGFYPELATWESMIEANSPLVKESLIPVDVAPKDMWQQPFEGSATKQNYVLKCQGDPGSPEERPAVTREPGKSGAAPAATAAPAAGGAAK